MAHACRRIRMKLKLGTIALICLALIACGRGSEKIPKPEPTLIGEFTEQVQIDINWSESGPEQPGRSYLQLYPSLADDKLFLTSVNGVVTALDRADGTQVWATELSESISAGVGASEDLVSVVSDSGKVIVLNAQDGQPVWEQSLSRGVFAPPLVVPGSVVVRTIGGLLYAFGSDKGDETWSFELDQPNFTLQGSTPPLELDRSIVAGNADGQIVGIDLATGIQNWQISVPLPFGNELTQGVEIADTAPVVYRNGLFVALQDRSVTSFDLQTGNQLWNIERNTDSKIAVDTFGVFGSDLDDRVYALDRFSGDLIWENDGFLHREISNIAVFQSYVVVTDNLGTILVMQSNNGQLVGVRRTGQSIVPGSIRQDENAFYLLYRSGRIESLSLNPVG